MNLIDFEHNFFGRQHVLDVLRKRVNGLKEGFRQNVALVGPKTIGKTAIVSKLVNDHDDRQTLLIYLDLENRDFSYFTRQWTKSLLYHYLKSEDLPLQEDLKLLCASCKERIPQTVAAIEQIEQMLDKDREQEVYQALLNLSEVFILETRKFLVYIVDEFQNLDHFHIPDAFAQLGMRIMTQKNCLYVMTSSYAAQAQTILSEKLSLLFGNFEIIHVGPFDLQASQALIDRHLEGLKVGLQLKSFLADFTGGYPLYINIMSQEMICLCGVHGQQEIYAPIVTQSLENLLFNPWGVLSRHFELKVHELCKGKSETVLGAVLIALSQGKHRIADLAAHLSLKPAGLTQRLNALMAADIVEKNGNYFHIKDKLFKYWIKYVYQRRLHAIDLEPGKSRKMFKDEITRTVNDFQVIARKDLSSRMVDLVHKFENEAFDLSGRRYKLSMFRDIATVKLRLGAGKYIDAIGANSEEGQWLIVLKQDPMLDSELHAFLEEIKKMQPKPARCVVVSLNGLDDNAKIRALQEKLWVWNQDEVNTLMHLFDEPYLV